MEGSALAERPAPEVKEGRVPFFVDFPFTRSIVATEGAKQLADFNDAIRGKGFDPVKTGDLELRGYASTWVMDRDQEYISPRAFDKHLEPFLRDNPILLWQHQRQQPVGQVLEGETDANGLDVRAWHRKPTTGESDWKFDAYQDVKAGIVQTFSIGGFFEREIVEAEILIVNVELMEISEVSIPSNPLSIFDASMKAAKGLPMKGDSPDSDALVVQMMQLLGMIPMADQFLTALDDTERQHYYGRLAVQFQGAKGIEAPPIDSYKLVDEGMDNRSSEETLKQARELVEVLATPRPPRGSSPTCPRRRPASPRSRPRMPT
jgi:HK97 family phage prohead protease